MTFYLKKYVNDVTITKSYVTVIYRDGPNFRKNYLTRLTSLKF